MSGHWLRRFLDGAARPGTRRWQFEAFGTVLESVESGPVMTAAVSAVAFDDHAEVETARCRVGQCPRMLAYERSAAPGDLLGWRRVETGSDRWNRDVVWRCPEHVGVP